MAVAQGAPAERGRGIGVPFEGVPGPLDAITDVPGVEVGQVSLDLLVTFSTAGTANDPDQTAPSPITPVASTQIDALFEGTVQATEEAIVNAMIAAAP
jgi:L-aminopeptidase/D-esterase-like protein